MNSISDCNIFATIIFAIMFVASNSRKCLISNGEPKKKLKLLNYNVNNYHFHLVILLDGKKSNYIHISLFIITIINLILIQNLP